jgi:hypothetical protein
MYIDHRPSTIDHKLQQMWGRHAESPTHTTNKKVILEVLHCTVSYPNT